MKVSGRVIRGKEWGLRNMKMETAIKESSSKVNLKAKEFSIGEMVNFMKVSFMKVSKKDLGHGSILRMDHHMLESGKDQNQMVMEFILHILTQQLVLSMKVSGRMG